METNYDNIALALSLHKADRDTVEWVRGYDVVLSQLGRLRGLKVLDYGCGGGNFMSPLLRKGAEVIGVDKSQAVLEEAQRRNPQATYMGIDEFFAGEVPDQSIDVAIANFVFCTVHDDLELAVILKQILRVLKPGGRLFFLETEWEVANGKDYGSFHCHYQDDLKSGDLVTVTLRNVPEPLTDRYRGLLDYQKLLKSCGFRWNRPIGGSDSPFLIYRGNKPQYRLGRKEE